MSYLAAAQGTAAAEDESIDLSPTRLMQRLVRFEVHDTALYSEADKRLLTNGPTMLEHIRKNREHLYKDLETGIEEPGSTADQAIQVFIGAVDSWMTPRPHSLTVTLMEGIHQDVSSAAAADMHGQPLLHCHSLLEQARGGHQ